MSRFARYYDRLQIVSNKKLAKRFSSILNRIFMQEFASFNEYLQKKKQEL